MQSFLGIIQDHCREQVSVIEHELWGEFEILAAS